MKKLVGIMMAFLVLLLGSSIMLHMVIDQKNIREHVIASLKEQAGLEVHMEHAEFEIFPWPSFHAQSVSVMKPHCAAFMTADSVHADLSLLKLFSREFSFQDFTAENLWISFHKPAHILQDTASSDQKELARCSVWMDFAHPQNISQTVRISQQKEDKKTWYFGQKVAPRWKISFDALHVSHGHILWHNDDSAPSLPSEADPRTGQVSLLENLLSGGEIAIESFDLAGMRTRSPWIDLHAAYQKNPLELKGHIGQLSRLFRLSPPHSAPWFFSVGLRWGENGLKEALTLDGSFQDPALLRGGKISVQGTISKIEPHSLLSEIFVPSLSEDSFSHLQGVISVEDKRLHTPPSEVTPDISQMKMSFEASLKSFQENLLPKMLHIEAEKAEFKKFPSFSFSDLLIDAAGENLPLLVQARILSGPYQWDGRFHFASLEQMNGLIFEEEGHSFAKIPFNASLEARRAEEPSLGFLSVHSSSASSHGQKNDATVINHDLALTLQGEWMKKQVQTHLTAECDDILLSLGAKTPLPSPHLHHARLETELEFGFDGQKIAFSQMKLKSDEGRITGEGSRLDQSINGHLILENLDVKRLFQHAPEGGQDIAKPLSLFNLAKNKRGAEEEFNHLIERMKNILHLWQWDMTIEGHHLDEGEILYKDLSLHSSLSGGGLQNSISGLYQPKNSDNAYNFAGTMSMTPSNAHAVRISLATETSPKEAQQDGLFFPASWGGALLSPMGKIEGVVQFIGSLSTEGENWAEMRNSLTGHVDLNILDGMMDNSFLGFLSHDGGEVLHSQDEMQKFRCFIGDFQLDAGHIMMNKMVLSTEELAVLGHGDIALSDNKLNLVFLPEFKPLEKRNFTAFHLEGSFSEPRMSLISEMDNADLTLQKSDEAGSKGDICRSSLEEMRQGVSGPALPALNASPSMGSLLHSLGL